MEARQKRNIVILGRTGTGKKTIANKLLGEERFKVDSAMTSVTRGHRKLMPEEKTHEDVHYSIKILDTLGPYSSMIDKRIILGEIDEYCKNVPEGINLILFTFRYGVYEPGEIEIFNAICQLYEDEIPKISALVITGCESLDEEGRTSLLKELRTETATRGIVQFMHKGIFPVGFPNLNNIKPVLREEYEQGISYDANGLTNLVLGSQLLTLDRDILARKPISRQLRSYENKREKGLSLSMLCPLF
ncbi:uncharacterized protein [Montipora capricornis]|uniref:uncharacterized protein n=1 Tax=Montipora capricornis TaxID=246305 RepID=UPI0035F2117B